MGCASFLGFNLAALLSAVVAVGCGGSGPPPRAPQSVSTAPLGSPAIRRAIESREEGQTKPTAKIAEPEKDANAYRSKLLVWFNTGFRLPTGIVPCSELKRLITRVTVTLGEERRVTSYSVTEASGNSVFDERARSSIDRIVGKSLPAPPPLYPEFNPRTLAIVFSGRDARCDDDARRD